MYILFSWLSMKQGNLLFDINYTNVCFHCKWILLNLLTRQYPRSSYTVIFGALRRENGKRVSEGGPTGGWLSAATCASWRLSAERKRRTEVTLLPSQEEVIRNFMVHNIFLNIYLWFVGISVWLWSMIAAIPPVIYVQFFFRILMHWEWVTHNICYEDSREVQILLVGVTPVITTRQDHGIGCGLYTLIHRCDVFIFCFVSVEGYMSVNNTPLLTSASYHKWSRNINKLNRIYWFLGNSLHSNSYKRK